jgi:transglutaminase-like putative cysteine protease
MRRLLIAGAVCACISPLAAQSYRVGPPPGWVKLHKPNLAAPAVRAEGWEYVLFDRQESVGPTGVERYWRIAYRIIDQAAVTDNSQIEVVFDPAYQRLTLHDVTVWRGAHRFVQLRSSRIHVARREPDLEDQIFDGSLTVVVVLEDVRPGDIIEYSFTRTGNNPVFRGHFMSTFQFQHDVPTADQYVRLLWRRNGGGGGPLTLHPLGDQATPQPLITGDGASREYEWSLHNIPALQTENDVPDWYVAYPTVQVSDFGSWHAVAAWGDSLFARATLPASLREVVERIRASSESDERRALQALRWVQDEIRYTGVEIGVNSHQPYDPAVVIKRRYGDCKDKALLLITMLRALDIPARPALVSTTYGGHVGDYAPSAGLFDHAIVDVTLSGREYWIDPTDVDQRGGIADVAASYGAALVLGPATDSLATMPNLRRPEPNTDIKVSFDIGKVSEPTTMRVETRYVGRTANRMRATVRGSREELQRSYLDYYAKLYPSIHAEELPQVTDDSAENELRTIERYTIPDFWSESDSTQGPTGKFEPLELSSAIPQATALERRMPLAINYPTHIRYQIRARFTGGWSIPARHERIATPAARFSYDKEVADNVLTFTYDYETLTDHVMPEAAKAHIKDMARAWDLLFYRVRGPASEASATSGRVNWSVLFAALFAAILSCLAALRVSRAQLALPGHAAVRVPVPGTLFPPSIAGEPEGIGGWLVLLAIGISVTPVRLLITMVRSLPGYGVASWARLTTPGDPAYHALWAPVLMFELIGNVLMFVFACLLVWMFFKRKKQFPIVFIGFAAANIVINLLQAVYLPLLPIKDAGGFRGMQVVAALLWILYMLRSRRVRNTFVN